MHKIEDIFRWLSVNLDKAGALIVLPAISIIVICDVVLRYMFLIHHGFGLSNLTSGSYY